MSISVDIETKIKSDLIRDQLDRLTSQRDMLRDLYQVMEEKKVFLGEGPAQTYILDKIYNLGMDISELEIKLDGDVTETEKEEEVECDFPEVEEIKEYLIPKREDFENPRPMTATEVMERMAKKEKREKMKDEVLRIRPRPEYKIEWIPLENCFLVSQCIPGREESCVPMHKYVNSEALEDHIHDLKTVVLPRMRKQEGLKGKSPAESALVDVIDLGKTIDEGIEEAIREEMVRVNNDIMIEKEIVRELTKAKEKYPEAEKQFLDHTLKMVKLKSESSRLVFRLLEMEKENGKRDK